jgi:uncharacterized protein
MRKGFTLVEILIAITVIVLAVVMLVIGFRSLSPTTTVNQGQAGTAANISIPAPTNYLIDAAGALKSETVTKLNTELQAFDTNSKNTAQIGVLVVTSTQPDTIEQYSIAVADNWKVGYKGSNEGILFVLATVDRKTRIEVGKGFEGTLTDVQAEDVLQQYAIPSFRKGDWDGGVTATVEALINKLNKS